MVRNEMMWRSLGGREIYAKMKLLDYIGKSDNINYISQRMRNSGVGNAKLHPLYAVIQEPHDESNTHALQKEQILKLKQSIDNLKLFIDGLAQFSQTILPDCVTALYTSHEVQSLTGEKVLKAAHLRVEKMIKNKKLKKNWSTPDILILVWVLAKYIEINQFQSTQDLTPKDWNRIAELIPGTTGDNCLFRWLNLHKNRLSFNQWSSEQSTLLQNIVKKQGTDNWKEVAQTLYRSYEQKNKVFRTAKQCREHWACYLNPVLKKGPWQQEEDIKLIKQILKHKGAKKWSVIAKKFNGRTQNALKNRYNLLLEKEIKQQKKNKNQNLHELDILTKYLSDRSINPSIQPSDDEIKLPPQSPKMQDISKTTDTPTPKKQVPILLGFGSAFKEVNMEEKEGKNGRRQQDWIPFEQSRVELINYLFRKWGKF